MTHRIALLALWVACAALNLTKAVHFDDAAYLEIARAIMHDPLHAMSTLMNWHDTAQPIWLINQPHPFFGVQALVMAVAPFSIFWCPSLKSHRSARVVAGTALTVVILTFATLWSHGRMPDIAGWWGMFLGNGVLTVGLVIAALMRRGRDEAGPPGAHNMLLFLWLSGLTAFMVLLAPFMAVRHAMLAVPAILLVFGSNLEPVLDRRRAASLPAHARVWSVGHWGWQWYARRAGMLQYDSARSVLNEGDYVVMPALPGRQVLSPPQRARLRMVRDITINSGPLTWLRTMSLRPYGGYYYFSLRDDSSPPWLTSTSPLETFTIYAVTK